MTAFTADERTKLYRICKLSKEGRELSEGEISLLNRLFKQNPDEYGEVQRTASDQAVRDYMPLSQIHTLKD